MKDLLAKRPQDKLTFGYSRMRYLQSLVVYDLVSVKQYVKINGPRSILDGFDATKRIFNILELVQKFDGRQRR